ncbi:MAG: ATP-binding protein [Verrucomicrobiota bacterium]|nr:ATP-binding protein [Verrucomicrobiota bacterium]
MSFTPTFPISQTIAASALDSTRLPLRSWALELAHRWNAAAHSVFILSGNIYDQFPLLKNGGSAYVSLKTFLSRRLFSERRWLIFYDISDGLTFASPAMQRDFYEWLDIYDTVEGTNYRGEGAPKDFSILIRVLRRFVQKLRDESSLVHLTLVIEYPEKLIPAAEGTAASQEERVALITLLKWATAVELREADVGLVLITENSGDLASEILRNPYTAQIHIDLPDQDERLRWLQANVVQVLESGKKWDDCADISMDDAAKRCAGLNLVRMHQLLAENLRNNQRITIDSVGQIKRRLIEDYCQGLVRFKEPNPTRSLDVVATHTAAKKKLRDLAWLIRQGKNEVLERGILVPGRVGVGKSFLIECFAAECGLPVLELAEFRSKWVGDTERQLMRILLTIRALGPVVVVVDEADAVLGNREQSGDSGVSSRVFATLAAHIGDSRLRGRELWVAMTSRPDLLPIDMKRQGRFGLCIPLFPAQNADEIIDLFRVIAKVRKLTLTAEIEETIRATVGTQALTGSEVEAMLVRAQETAVLAGRDNSVEPSDLLTAITSFIDPLDPRLLRLQELAAVLACSDRRFLPERYTGTSRDDFQEEYAALKRYF